MKSDGQFRFLSPVNEPVRAYVSGDAQRRSLLAKVEELSKQKIEIPLIIGGKEIRTGQTRKVVMPCSHREVLAEFHLAGAEEMKLAAKAALDAKAAWESMHWEQRAAIFYKAADLLAGPWRELREVLAFGSRNLKLCSMPHWPVRAPENSDLSNKKFPLPDYIN